MYRVSVKSSRAVRSLGSRPSHRMQGKRRALGEGRQPGRRQVEFDSGSRTNRKLALIAALGCLLVPYPASAAMQQLDDRPDQGFLQDRAAYSHEVAAERCLTPLTVNPRAPVRQATCTVEDLRSLGDGGGGRWYVARYRRSAIVDWGEPADSMEWDEVVLLNAVPERGLLLATWHIRTERAIEFLNDVQATLRSEGLLIEVLICLNGTGGCAREYLLDSGSGLEYVHMPFAADLQARLTDGQRLHKGMTLDRESLRGTWPVSRPGDANCCPSLLYEYTIRLEGTDMVLVSASLRSPSRLAVTRSGRF